MVIIGRVLACGLVVEPHTSLVDEDYALVVAHGKTDCAHEMKYRTPRLPLQISVAILGADPTCLGKAIAEFPDLVVRAPQRSAYRDAGQLSAAVLEGIGLAGHAVVFLGQPDVKHSPKVHVAAGASGGEDNRLPRADVQGLTLVGSLDSQNLSGGLCLAEEARHLVLQKDLHVRFSGRRFERPHEANSGGSGRRFGWVHRLSGLHQRPAHGGGMIFPGSGVPSRTGPEVIGGFLDKNDTVSNEPFEGWRAIVSKRANNFFVVVTVIGEAV